MKRHPRRQRHSESFCIQQLNITKREEGESKQIPARYIFWKKCNIVQTEGIGHCMEWVKVQSWVFKTLFILQQGKVSLFKGSQDYSMGIKLLWQKLFPEEEWNYRDIESCLPVWSLWERHLVEMAFVHFWACIKVISLDAFGDATLRRQPSCLPQWRLFELK